MTLPPLAAEEFPAVFAEIHGHLPFPWQARLMRRLADPERGSWPDLLDLPTGSGKTATIDVALFHLALEAGRGADRRAPVRTVFVVDRRLIVDEAADRAERIARALAQATGSGPLARMAARLRATAGGDEQQPVVVRRLRGGIPREDDWARSPAQPTILCSTVDQVGSRLLFRGYGVSAAMKSIHAGLLGSDCLLLLDEAHLAVPLTQTLARIAAFRAPPWCQRTPAPWRFVTLSATPGHVRALSGNTAEDVRSGNKAESARSGNTAEDARSRNEAENAQSRNEAENALFRLDTEDHRHPALKARLAAPKPATLKRLDISARDNPDQHAQAFADAASQLFMAGGINALAVVVNRVALARSVWTKLSSAVEAADVVLLTGRIRGVDRDREIARAAPRLKSGRRADAGSRPLIVVATQTIEAGADFDFDALVTQIAPLDALRQRFGRLNRMGRAIAAPATILAARDEIAASADDAVYGDRPRKTWDWLTARAGRAGEGNVGRPGALVAADATKAPAGTGAAAGPAPAPLAKAVAKQKKGRPAETVIDFGLDAFAALMADDRDVTGPVGEADVAGPVGEAADVAGLIGEAADAPILRPADVLLLSWTAPIPAVDPALAQFLHGPKAGEADVQIVWRADLREVTLDQAGELIALVPPHAGETLAVPLWAAKSWLSEDRTPAQVGNLSDLEGIPDPDPKPAGRRDRPAFRWAGSESTATGVIRAMQLRAGDVIVVPAGYGGCDTYGWFPESPNAVTDLGDERPSARRWTKRLHRDLMPGIWDRIAPAVAAESDLPLCDRLAVLKTAGIVSPVSGPTTLHRPAGYDGAVLVTVQAAAPGRAKGAAAAAVTMGEAGGEAVTEDDESGSLTGQGLSLQVHGESVAAKAAAFATAAGLAAEMVADVALAGLLHDLGKADRRFQTWLHGGDRMAMALTGGEPLAKSVRILSRAETSAARKAAGLPERWRHEADSVLRALADPRLAAAHDTMLVLWLIGVHHGHGRPLFPHHDPSAARDQPGPHRPDFHFEGLDWPGMFERLTARYGPWELARLEAIVRLADHRASEEAAR